MAEVTGGIDNSIKYFNRDQITKSYQPGKISYNGDHL